MPNEQPEHLYRLQYQLHAYPEGFTKEVAAAATEEGFGSCDKMILLSIIENTDGSSSTRILSMDGETGEPVNDHELFHAWAGLADKLAQSRELDPGRREFAAQVMSVIRGAYRAMRGA